MQAGGLHQGGLVPGEMVLIIGRELSPRELATKDRTVILR